MKRLVLAVVAFFAAAVVPRPAATQEAFVVRPAATPCLIVRSRPDRTARRRACITPGTQVTGIASAPYWRRIVLPDGTRGWAAKHSLQLVNASPASVSATDRWLEVHFVDVGQGDAVWIRTADDGIPNNGAFENLSIVIDGGPDKLDHNNALLKYMSTIVEPRTPIDAMILTHPHDDHYPGLQGLLPHFPVRHFYDTGYPKSGPKWAAFMTAVRQAQAQGAQLHIGRDAFGTLNWGSELRADILHSWPGQIDAGDLGRDNTLENNASIVLKLTYGQHSFLFMGDAEGKEREDSPSASQYVEARLLRDPSRLKSTVLKIAHHGSETSSTIDFMTAVDPDYVVVMSGRRSFRSRYLPDASTLKRYCDRRPTTRILRTDQDDEEEGRTTSTDADDDHVVIKTNGTRMDIETYSNGRRISIDACSP